MIRKLMLVLLAGAICLLAVTSVLAKHAQVYQLKEYEQLIGKKLEFDEAPMLRIMVAAGELPPLKERLPEDPLVVKPAEEIGQYGGVFHKINEGLAFSNWSMDAGIMFLAAYSPDMSKIFPNVLKGWEVSEDVKKFTLYLRKGMRWSDGYPFTADDLMFYFEDIALNKDLSPVPPSRLMAGGEPGVARKMDDYTIEVSFRVGNGGFIEALCRWRPNPYAPKHYLEQFHPKYTSMDEIKKTMKKEGFDTWVSLFQAKCGGTWDFWSNPERPVIGPWVAQNYASEPIQTLTRNPYFWKVDTEGNQLPYIDKVERFLMKEPEPALLKVLAGEIDYMDARWLGGVQIKSIVMKYQESGNYRLVPLRTQSNNFGTIYFNMTHKDPTLRKLFQDKRFRIALSVAINREKINKLVYKGLAVPSHPSVIPGPPYYGERLFKNYLQYDPKLANRLLDESGLSKRDKEGYRLRPNGERLRMTCLVSAAHAVWMEMAELYKEDWKAIGIETVNKPVEFGLVANLIQEGDYDLQVSSATYGGRPLNPLNRAVGFPLSRVYGVAPKWGLWFESKGKEGEEPPEDLKRVMEIREKAILEVNEEKKVALTLEALKIIEENLWVVGGMNQPREGDYAIVTNRVRNMASPLMYCEGLHEIYSQFFIRE